MAMLKMTRTVRSMMTMIVQGLEERTQHCLTACVAPFIYTKEWTGRLSSQRGRLLAHSPELSAQRGRLSAQSLNSELKMETPPGDEVWAQKCHELDFQVLLRLHDSLAHFLTTTPQVALLKEERSNLIVENEDLVEKVRAAQTLSRKVNQRNAEMPCNFSPRRTR